MSADTRRLMSEAGRPRRRKSIRLKNYDYRSPGYYYVTFCTDNRKCVFGDVVDGAMILSDYGRIVDRIWNFLPHHFLTVGLDAIQIMPNHVHAIIIIEEREHALGIDDHPFKSNPTLGQIVGYWKYQSAKGINAGRTDIEEIWQSNMFEHVIRNERELREIRIYIKNNPGAWTDDIDNPVNLKLLQRAEAERRVKQAQLPTSIII